MHIDAQAIFYWNIVYIQYFNTYTIEYFNWSFNLNNRTLTVHGYGHNITVTAGVIFTNMLCLANQKRVMICHRIWKLNRLISHIVKSIKSKLIHCKTWNFIYMISLQ